MDDSSADPPAGKGKEGAGKGKGGKGKAPPPPAPKASGKPKPKPAAPARPPAPVLSLEEARARMKKVKQVDKTKRPPAMVRGVKFWLNMPAAARALPPKGEEGGLELIPHLFEQGAKVVLVDFFAYSCTNCLRVVPVLRRWHETYGPHGLTILAFHRPEFDFERDAMNMRGFVEREGVQYMVGLDNTDAAWKDWEVTMWPSSFMVVPDGEPGAGDAQQFKIVKEHYGDRNHHELEALIRARTIGAGKVDEYNNKYFADAEFFLGKEHRYKNIDAGNADPGCGEGACKPRTKDEAAAGVEVVLPGNAGRTVYGAGWCRFCQKTKALLGKLDLPFEYHDVDSMGGASHVFQALKAKAGLPESHGTIPIVYGEDGAFVGGWTELVTALRAQDRPDLEQTIADVEAQSTSTAAEFDKFGHQLSASLTGGATNHEFYLAKEDASITLNIIMSSKEPVHVFAVASFNDEALQSRREQAYAKVEAMAALEADAVRSFAGESLVQGDEFASLSPNEAAPVFNVSLDGEEERAVPLTFPGRVLLATVPATEDGVASGKLAMRLAPGIKIYTFFLTSEPL